MRMCRAFALPQAAPGRVKEYNMSKIMTDEQIKQESARFQITETRCYLYGERHYLCGLPRDSRASRALDLMTANRAWLGSQPFVTSKPDVSGTRACLNNYNARAQPYQTTNKPNARRRALHLVAVAPTALITEGWLPSQTRQE